MSERMNVPTDYPVTSETLPCPRPPVLGDGDQVAVAPKCVAVVGILVHGALEPFRPVGDTRLGLAGHRGMSCWCRQSPSTIEEQKRLGKCQVIVSDVTEIDVSPVVALMYEQCHPTYSNAPAFAD